MGERTLNGEQNRSPLVTDQMESSLALNVFCDFADVAPKNGDFG